jgi:hypothetical protein
VPYRVGSPRLIGEMIGHWKEEGYFTGAWFYPPQCWVWPDTLDIVEDEAGAPRRLVAFERDELWHLLEGRYLWKADREVTAEHAWASGWLGRKFGNAGVGAHLVDWHDLTGPILPGLQNLTAVRFGNFFPTSIAWVQATVDDILSYRTSIDETPLAGPTGLTRQRYYSRPIDAFTVELYRERHGIGPPRDLRSMPVAQYAEELAAGREPEGYILPDKLIDLYLEMARRALDEAKAAAALETNDPAEMRRFVQDSECLVLTVEYYRHKILAALEKRLLEKTGDPARERAFRGHIEASVPAYERMFEHARRFYTKGTSMWDAKPWERCLEEKVKPDRDAQLAWLAARATAIEVR